MNESEKLGITGLVGLGVIALGAIVALVFGFSALLYLALPLTAGAFVVMFMLCSGRSAVD